MLLFILLLYILCLGLLFSPRNVRSCGCLRMIFGTRPLGHHPRSSSAFYWHSKNKLVSLHSTLILGSRGGGQRPTQCNLSKLVLLRDLHTKLISQYDCKEVCVPSQSQGNLDWAPRMVSLISRRLLLFPFRNSTVSLSLPFHGMRDLSPMLVLLTFLHSLRSPSRSYFTVSPSGTLSLNSRYHVVLNS